MRIFIKSLLARDIFINIANWLCCSKPIVLCFHDVCKEPESRNWMRLPALQFNEIIGFLASNANFLTINDLFDPNCWSKKKINVLITFDDGYINNLRVALPILRKHDAPATFFVSTDHIRNGNYFWPDLIIDPINRLGLKSIDLSNFGLRQYYFRESPTDRWEDISILLSDVKALGNPADKPVADLLKFFSESVHTEVTSTLRNYRPMNPDELRELSSCTLAEIGSHGHFHELLNKNEDSRLNFNLVQSKSYLESILHKPIDSLAYPNGTHDMRVIDAARRANYYFCFTTTAGLVGEDTDRLTIPRLLVGGFDDLNTFKFCLLKTFVRHILRRKT